MFDAGHQVVIFFGACSQFRAGELTKENEDGNGNEKEKEKENEDEDENEERGRC